MALNSGGDDFLTKSVNANALFTSLANQLQITWTYEAVNDREPHAEELSTPVVVPPRQVLESLLKPAQEADIQALRTLLAELTKAEPTYRPFFKPILQLSRQFQIEEIETLLQKYLTEDLHRG